MELDVEPTVDCAGNATSTSTETGNQTSLVWNWEWLWDWACKSEDIGSSVTTSTSSSTSGGNTNVSVRVLSPGDDGSVTQTTESTGRGDGAEVTDASSTGLWNWNWTFTFCDETTAVSTLIDSQTPLSWTWTWMWNWTCDGAAGAPPARRSRSTASGCSAGTTAVGGDTTRAGSGDSGVGSHVYGGCATDAEVSASSRSVARAVTRTRAVTRSRRGIGRHGCHRPRWTSGLLRFRSSCWPSPASPASSRFGGHRARRDARCARGRRPNSSKRARVPGHREAESSTPPPMTTPISLRAPGNRPERIELDPHEEAPSAHSAPPRQKHGPQLPFGQSRSYGTAGSGTSGGRGAHRAGRRRSGDHRVLHSCRPTPGAATSGCTGAEPARHVPLLDRPPGLRAVSPRPDASAAPPSAWCHTDSSKGDKVKRAFIALTVALLLLLVAGVGTAAADPPASQGWGQWAESQEDAGAAVGAAPRDQRTRAARSRNRTRPRRARRQGTRTSRHKAQSRTRALARLKR